LTSFTVRDPGSYDIANTVLTCVSGDSPFLHLLVAALLNQLND